MVPDQPVFGEKPGDSDAELIEAVLNNKNDRHNNYQNVQTFLDQGGRSGLQHDALPYGAYNLNPLYAKGVTGAHIVLVETPVAETDLSSGWGTIDAATSMLPRASSSDGSRTARSRFALISRSACRAVACSCGLESFET